MMIWNCSVLWDKTSFANEILRKLKSAGEEPVEVLDRGFITVAENVVDMVEFDEPLEEDNNGKFLLILCQEWRDSTMLM